MKTTRVILSLVAALIVGLCARTAAIADSVYLNDGRVLEGVITREGDTFIYITTKIGDIEKNELILKTDISRIVRDSPDSESIAEAATIKPGGATKSDEPANVPEGATRIAFLRLGWEPEDTVGPYINKDALQRSVEELEGKADVLVLWIDTGGGDVGETVKLVNYIQKDIKPKFRLVGWVKRAISGGSFTMHPIEELYFMPEASYGGSVAFSMTGPGQAKAAEGAFLEQMLEFGELASSYGHHEPLIMRAMQIRIPLSVDIDEDGVAHWREDLEGKYIVSTDDRILTLNSQQAMQFGFAKGIASTKEELVEAMGYKEWVEVGQDVDDKQQKFRDDMKTAENEIAKAARNFQFAIENQNLARARKFLSDLKTWARRAPAWQDFSTGGLPPLNRELFRELERQVDELAKQVRERERNSRR
ncbi:MAG: hypothetical protein H6813_06920 [Phycisphaeraceae bacterium]|nr:hypothetical protein [Phycisphaeraceae bacterium]MCB9848667.1 hypothetical protein [Phycisphaeraceae bacterium]